MDVFTISALVLMGWIFVFGAIACLSWKRMVKKEKRLISEGKEIPEWIAIRRRYVKYFYDKFQKRPKLNFVLFVAVFAAMVIVTGLIEGSPLKIDIFGRIMAGLMLLMFVTIPFGCCLSVRRMRKEEARFKAEGNEIPEWITKRQAFFKECEERFKKTRRMWIVKCVVVVALLMVISMGLF